MIFFLSHHFVGKNVVTLCFFVLGGSWLQGCCCFHFWRQPDAPTSKKNGKNFGNRVENWHPKYQASEIHLL
jgi:hypothetical protein